MIAKIYKILEVKEKKEKEENEIHGRKVAHQILSQADLFANTTYVLTPKISLCEEYELKLINGLLVNPDKKKLLSLNSADSSMIKIISISKPRGVA